MQTGNSERLIGYVLAATKAGLDDSRQVLPIRDFCRKNKHFLVYLEPEAGNSATLMRPGLWQAVRSLICYKCASDTMPPNLDAVDWLTRVFEICPCGEPEGLDGLVVAMPDAICTNQTNGARLAFALAQIGKHLYIATEGRCVSCCNPAARELIRKQAQQREKELESN
jgi:hypothetical protein